MGKWLAALKNNETVESANPRNLPGDGFEGFEGTRSGADANFIDPRGDDAEGVLKVLRVKVSRECGISAPRAQAVPAKNDTCRISSVDLHRDLKLDPVARPDDADRYADALRLHGPMSYGMVMRVLGWGGTRAGQAETALRAAGRITFNNLGRAVLCNDDEVTKCP